MSVFFPDDVFRRIFTYLPHPYRTTSHFLAVTNDTIYICFMIKIHFYYAHHAPTDWDIFNEYFVYKQWFHLRRSQNSIKN